LPNIDRVGPYRVIIYLDDHEPAHVHVVHSSGSVAIFNIGRSGKPELRELRGDMKDNDVKRAYKLVQEKQTEYLEKWLQIHGDKND
jgi:hypothetical protein